MSTQITTLGIKVTQTGAAKAKKEINSIGATANKVKKAIGLLGGALAVLGVAKALKASIKYTASIEDLRIQLKFLTGSTKNASKAFAEMTKFASETPFALQDIQKSSASLLVAVGNDVDKLGGMLLTAGEISAQFGLSFVDASLNLQKAMSAGIGAADMFREKGVAAMMGFRVGVSYSIEETAKIIKKWTEDNKGAIAELKNTFTGKVSMMGDAWDKLLLTFGEAGVLEQAKTSVQEMTEFLKDPETIKGVKAMADGFSDILKTLINIGKSDGLKQLNDFGNNLWDNIFVNHFGLKQLNDEIDRAINLKREGSGDPFAIFDEPFIPKVELPKMVAQIETKQSPAEALKMEARQWAGVAKITSKVFNITEKLTKKRTELEKITEAQISAEKILGTQLKNSKITMEQYTEGINSMKVEIQNYADVIEQIAFDKKMENMAQDMEDSITDSLMNMGQGLSSFKDLATSIFREIASEMVRVQIARPLASAASGFLSSMFGSMFGAPAGGGASASMPHATFAGGGFTGTGSRSGGVDGQGGFPAILHPNETVIDHAKGGQVGGNVTNVTNISVEYSPQVNALDPRTAAMVIAENAPMVVSIIRQAFNRNGQSVPI